MRIPKIALSAGHYVIDGKDKKDTAGVYNEKFDIWEHYVCQDIINSVYARLMQSKVVVPYGIETGPLFYKVKQMEESNCDIALEVHLNWYGGENRNSVTGIETVYEDREDESRKLATMIQGQLVMDLGDRDRGLLSDNEVKERRGWKQFYLFDKLDGMTTNFNKRIPIVTVLTEVGFLSNDIFAEKCYNHEIQILAGKAIADAVESYVENVSNLDLGDSE